MKYTRFIMVGLVFAFLMYVFFVVYQNLTRSNGQNPQINQEQTDKQQWETKTDEQPPVTVSVTPLELGRNAQVWKFDIALDTHSGSLDDDLNVMTILVDDKGNTYQPISWERPEPGGHHREGMLIFNAINPSPPYVKLKIKNVGGVPERSFKWYVE